MGFFDFFFGDVEDGNIFNNKKHKSLFDENDDYEDYYEELHSDALSGDEGAIDEMEDEFGDDWESEY